MTSHNLVKEIIITEEQIKERVAQLAKEIKNYYQDIKKPLVLIGILRGCLPFFSDFMMKLDMECEIEFMGVESYKATSSAIEPRIKFDIFNDIKDRDVLVIEDILDSGKTLVKLINHLAKKQPKSLKFLTLLNRKIERDVDVTVDWFGFEVQKNDFLVGYGLDCQEMLRNLPYIAVLDFDKFKALKKI